MLQKDIALEFRLCLFYDDNVEDEYHFFFSCNLYNDLRSSLFDYLQQDVPDFDTFNDKFDVMQCVSKKKLLNLYSVPWK